MPVESDATAAPAATPGPRRRESPPATPAPQPQPPAQPPPAPGFRSQAMAGAMGLGLVAAVGGTYLLSDNDAVFPFAVAACVATFSSVLLRFALAGVAADGAARTRVRHFRAHRHFTGERAAYVRTSQRLAMMDRDFTAADYEMLLDLDNNSQRLRRFLEGASHETVSRLPTYIFRKRKEKPTGEPGAGGADAPEGEAADGKKAGSANDLPSLHHDDDSDSPEIAGATAKSCTICLEDFEDGMKIRILPCFHRFMADCIDPWLVQQARCPVCKYSIQEVLSKLPPGCE